MIYLCYLTDEQFTNLTDEEFATAQAAPPSNAKFDEATVVKLLRPLFIPSGRWADYNWVVAHYDRVKEWQEIGFISGDIDIPYPDPADYPDLTSPRSTTWDTI